MIILHFELIISQDFQSLNPITLEEDSSLYDVKVYENNISLLDYCYIDDQFKTHCSNEPYEGYN